MRVPLLNLVLVALLCGSGCGEEEEKKPRATQPSAEASGGTIREGTGNRGARVTGGVFNDLPPSQPMSQPTSQRATRP